MARQSTRVKAPPKKIVPDNIEIRGARVHNLRDVTVSIPRGKLVVVTGVSGSGKSSLTIDTLFAEGQRRYAESLSAYARQFMARMEKPDVDDIKGLCPAIAIEQKVITRTPRSTVGSMTEIYDYLRLLFARVGKTISPISGTEVKKSDSADVLKAITAQPAGSKIFLLTTFRQHANRQTREELNILMQKGFSRIYLRSKTESVVVRIEEWLELSDKELDKKCKQPHQQVFVLVDRFVSKDWDEDDRHRMNDSITTAFYEGEGKVWLETGGDELLVFTNQLEADGMRFEDPVPNLFSFNNPYGACPLCEGFSQVLGIDEDLVIPDKQLSLYEGAVAPWKGEKLGWWKEQFIKGAGSIGFPIHKPIVDCTPQQYKMLWEGSGKVYGIHDFFKEVEQNLYKVQYRVLLSRYRGRTTCTSCSGYRLRKEALYVKIGGHHIGELCEWQVRDLQAWIKEIRWTDTELAIARRILIEIEQRLQTMLDVGLGYLTLNRLANSLSGGESQRIQLTRSLGSNLTDSLYILDEPSIGLHARDTGRLIRVLQSLRNLGNTVVVVEHDEMMMREADYIIDMGPLASHLGGRVVAAGTYKDIIGNLDSLTGAYLSGQRTIDAPKTVRKWNNSIWVKQARQNNLKGISVQFPLNVLCVVSGVSGSGKTTLVKQILVPALRKLKGEGTEKPGLHKELTGDADQVDHVEMIDQHPIGKSSRSNPVTYIKAWDPIRDLYAKQPLSKTRGFMPKHFSFNVDGGRCDTCNGEGEQLVEMQFLADVHLVCESCRGKRFKDEVLEVTFRQKSIFDVLDMSVDDALQFFEGEKSIAAAIQPLQDVGLGYIKLGQSSDTLSGGEAQRVKLASFLGKGRGIGKILFVFDEPTTGLHFHDIHKLLASFHALIGQGHSVLVIEHNLDVIRCSDWVIELGPDAGDGGGELVYAGVPAGLKKEKKSFTGQFL
ncbi:MAG: excinuclease ABC subunit UvrA [Bacteroidota bacterium]|jgi:excinuclease ABC subunit A